MFIRLADFSKVTLREIRTENPNVSFSAMPTSEELTLFGYAVLLASAPPDRDVVTEGVPAEFGEGDYIQTWEVRDFTAEEKTQQRVDALPALEAARKAAEAQGVTVNGIRYAGDPSNRQALNESLQFAAAASMTTFAGWKDSDGVFHIDHPVADVQAAYEAIGYRRGALIALEGQYAAQIIKGEIVDIAELSWEV